MHPCTKIESDWMSYAQMCWSYATRLHYFTRDGASMLQKQLQNTKRVYKQHREGFLSEASQGSLAFVHISSMAVSRGSEPTEIAKLVLRSASPLEMHTVCLFMHYVYRHTYTIGCILWDKHTPIYSKCSMISAHACIFIHVWPCADGITLKRARC